MTAVLGLSCFYHDSAAAIVVGPDLIAAAQQERFSRIKHNYLFPINATRFCLEQAGLRLSELDAIVFYEDPEHKLFAFSRQSVRTIPIGDPSWRTLPDWLHGTQRTAS